MTASARPGPLADGYRPEIDGLRALAIAPVVMHHTAPALLPGGFVGVDVFFVISGYLITGIIAGELAEGRFSVWGFWERRVRRIVPALAAMLMAALACGWALLIPEDFYAFAKALAASAVFGSNLLYARDVDYFDTGTGSEALVHTWTLGVEEQFYLAFPLVLLAVWRWRPSAALPVLAVLALASFGLALALIPRWPMGAFYLLPTRMWELLIGAVAVLLPRFSHSPRVGEALALAGLALIGAGFVMIERTASLPGPLLLLPTCGTALVLLFARDGTIAARALTWRPAVLLGLVSFGLYLWHQPALYFSGYLWIGGAPLAAKAAAVAIALGLAAASYRWLERPVRERRLLHAPRRLLVVCGAALALPLAAGTAGYGEVLLPAIGAEAARLDGIRPERAWERVIIPPEGQIGFVLFGDSHARQYYAALTERFGPGAMVILPGCLAADGLTNMDPAATDAAACAAQPEQLERLVRARGVRTVIWAQRWERIVYAANSAAPIGTTAEEPGAAALLGAIERTRARLQPGTRVILIGNSPTAQAGGERFHNGWLRCTVAINVDCPHSYPEVLAEGGTMSARLATFATSRPDYAYVDPRKALCRAGACFLVQDGMLNYYDGSHLTLSGARRVVAMIDPALILR